jgi:hypothetical protein
VAGKGVSTKQRGFLPAQHKLPWLHSDEEWCEVLRALKGGGFATRSCSFLPTMGRFASRSW